MKAIETALSLTQSYKLAIERLEKMLGEEFKSAVNVMQKTSEHIIVCGMGKSGLVGRKISSTLASTGTPSIFQQKNFCSKKVKNLGLVKTMKK